MSKKTLVIGASEKAYRYSNMAIKLLQEHGHEVIAIGAKKGVAHGVSIDKNKDPFQDIHTITVYVNEKIQQDYIDYFLSLKPKRIIFNPGTENRSAYPTLKEIGIEVIEACTLVMLRTDQF